MKGYILITACLLSTLFSSAQINHGGQPLSWSLDINSTAQVPVVEMPKLNLAVLRAEDEVNDKDKENAYRFGEDQAVNISFFQKANKATHANQNIYQMAIHCPDAIAVGLFFDVFHIPNGGALYIYNEDRSEVKGAFTSESNKETGVFPVGIVAGDKLIIEYNGPMEGAALHISEITHAYRAVLNKWVELETRGPFGEADECHINVSCPEGQPWQDQKRSVVLITEGGENLCSGAIIANTRKDGTPYLLTANHCLGDPSGWVFYFNHDSETCDGNTGPTEQSIAGATLRASRVLSDFALIELSAEIPSDYNVFFAGWDNSDEATVTRAISIHHPRGDVKKITFEEDNPSPEFNSANFEVWTITQWEAGATQGGSSGSPLFDQNGRIIGQLNGGRASCNGTSTSGYSDFYGRFGVDWDGPDSTSRVKDWLDPDDLGVVTQDGYGPSDTSYALNAVNMEISEIPKIICTNATYTPNFTFKNNGTSDLTSATIQVSYNGVAQAAINWTGTLAQNELETIQLTDMTPVLGSENIIEVVIADLNGTTDEYPADNAIQSIFQVPAPVTTDSEVNVTILTDDYAYETSWRVFDAAGTEILNGGLFSSYDQFTTYTDVISFPSDGCYSFVLYDNFGDGICCGSGEGSYTLTDSQGNVLATGGEFDGRETVVIEKIASTVSTQKIEFEELADVFPNPTRGSLNIQLKSGMGEVVLRLTDVLGQVVKTEKIKENLLSTLDVQDLVDGAYILELSYSDRKAYQKIILSK